VEEKEKREESEGRHLTLDLIRSEVNMLVLPYFALWDKDIHRRTETEFKVVIRRGDKKLEISWLVAANPKFGYPGPFDRLVFRAIEQIISKLPPPVENPIPLGSLYSLCKRMGISPGGNNYKRIKEALTRLMMTGVISKGTFYSKKEKKWIEDAFHLIDRVVFKGEEMPNGETADGVYVWMNSWYLENINARYVKPIDWDYLASLTTSIAQRLCEFLSVKFFGLLMKGGRSISYKYSTLCDLLPISRQRYLSKAKEKLDPAHRELKETGFLENWTWEEIKRKGKEKDWLVTYYPGDRARKEIERFKGEIEPADVKTPTGSTEDLSPIQNDLIEELEQINVSKDIAEELVRNYNPDLIEQWIEAIRYTKAKDPAAYIVKAIKKGWSFPENYLKALRGKQSLLSEKKDEEKKRRRIKEEIERLNSLYESLSPPQKAQVDKEIEMRLPSFAREKLAKGKTDSPALKAAWERAKIDVIRDWIELGRIHP